MIEDDFKTEEAMIPSDKITLVCFEDRYPAPARRLVDSQKSLLGLDHAIMFGGDGSDVKVPKVNHINDYNRFMLKELNNYIDTEYVLVIQLDGFCSNPSKWEDEFLSYDYIGAPWRMGQNKRYLQQLGLPDHDNQVGNGGFSLRSKKLLEFFSTIEYDEVSPEDTVICLKHYQDAVDAGLKYAPFDLAERFSSEPYHTESFGFHGNRDLVNQYLRRRV